MKNVLLFFCFVFITYLFDIFIYFLTVLFRSHYYSNIDLSENGDEKTYQNLISNKDYKLKYDAECGNKGSPNLPPIVHNKYR
jgi:hypothetical protein